jgi:hypothetical protein
MTLLAWERGAGPGITLGGPTSSSLFQQMIPTADQRHKVPKQDR